MDEYPAHSLDHNIPLLVTLGLAQGTSANSELGPDLKEQAILIRSDVPTVEGDHAAALLKYIQDGDASKLEWNGRDTSRRYKFKIKAAGRVSVPQALRSSLCGC